MAHIHLQGRPLCGGEVPLPLFPLRSSDAPRAASPHLLPLRSQRPSLPTISPQCTVPSIDRPLPLLPATHLLQDQEHLAQPQRSRGREEPGDIMPNQEVSAAIAGCHRCCRDRKQQRVYSCTARVQSGRGHKCRDSGASSLSPAACGVSRECSRFPAVSVASLRSAAGVSVGSADCLWR